MNKDKNSIICITIVCILSLLNIFSMYISEFIITRRVVYTDLSLMDKPLEITSRALNFTYLGLVVFTVAYFLFIKSKKDK